MIRDEFSMLQGVFLAHFGLGSNKEAELRVVTENCFV